ncbi:50S ribosomal protein L34e [uncultured archaeon]|nr:50S ribosomal protein L34e [uncultured archaeon]
MPVPKNRSTSVRKIHVRTPKSGHTLHFKRRVKGNAHLCGLCGAYLQGVHSSRKLPGSAHSPNRMFGGNLCTSCTSRVLKARSRIKEGALKLADVDVTLLKYVKQ